MSLSSPLTIPAHHFASLVQEHDGGAFLTGAMRNSLTLHTEGDLSIVWAPFDHMPQAARLVVVGITPGRQQAENALAAFRVALANGRTPQEASRHAKLTGSFSGPMRRNLVDMLDHVGAARALGVATTAEVFAPGRELVHFTSALRYPVFVRDSDYNGTPDMIRTRCLRAMIDTCLADEARSLPGALWLPLGPKAEQAAAHLIAGRLLDEARVIRGLPHPSGANGERIAYFLGRKAAEALSSKTRPGPIDQARARLRAQFTRLAG